MNPPSDRPLRRALLLELSAHLTPEQLERAARLDFEDLITLCGDLAIAARSWREKKLSKEANKRCEQARTNAVEATIEKAARTSSGEKPVRLRHAEDRDQECEKHPIVITGIGPS